MSHYTTGSRFALHAHRSLMPEILGAAAAAVGVVLILVIAWTKTDGLGW